MAPALTQGKPATFNHVGVRYSPFGAGPGKALVLTADPWAFLGSYLRKSIRKSRGENRLRFERALYYAELANAFYNSAASTPLPAKCTLVYYGVLNLAKCFISAQGKLLGDSIERHGLSPSNEEGMDISVSRRARNHINVFQEFVIALGSEYPSKTHLSLDQCIAHIPELHELAFQTGILAGNNRCFLPIDVRILVDDNDEWLFTDFCYWKKNESQVERRKILSGERDKYFMPARELADGRILHRCKRRKRFNWENFERIYSNLCKEYSKFDIATLLGRDGYRYYCNLNSPEYHHLAYTFVLLFYFGTITRYDPAKTKDLIDGDLRPIVSEALQLCPTQMLYQLVSRITQSVCVMPFAKL